MIKKTSVKATPKLPIRICPVPSATHSLLRTHLQSPRMSQSHILACQLWPVVALRQFQLLFPFSDATLGHSRKPSMTLIHPFF